VQATADRFYRGRDDVVLLEINPAQLDVEVRVEPARADSRGFPHLYGPLAIAAVVATRPLALGPDGRLETGLAAS
jgi:uncharacterized protein (DUF952 family)